MTDSPPPQDPDPSATPEEHTSKFENPVSIHGEDNPESIHGEDNPESQPQSPQTLEPSKIQDPQKSDPIPEESEALEQDEQESSGMMSLRSSFTPKTRKGQNFKRTKKKGGYYKKQQNVKKKVENMLKHIVLIPFEPVKILDFDKHEELLKRLGLWDFAHIEFDKSIRAELICQFIATSDFSKRACYVNELRINLSRTEFARAFKLPLPTKKDKSVGNAADAAIDVELVWEKVSEESVKFVEDFVRSWVVLHGEDWVMTNEIMNWMGFIKDGHPEKVDWASLFWLMVEAELKQKDQLKTCYYASHLQYFIKSQRREFSIEDDKEEVVLADEEMKEEEKSVTEGDNEVEIEEVKKEDLLNEPDKVDEKEVDKDVREAPHYHEAEAEAKVEEGKVEEVKVEEVTVEELKEDKDGSFNELTRGGDTVVSEEPYIGLCLGHHDIVVKEEIRNDGMMDGEECKEKKQDHWGLVGNDNSNKHFLQPCNVRESRGLAENGNSSNHFLQPCNFGESRGLDGNEEIGQEVEHVEMEDEGDQMEEEGDHMEEEEGDQMEEVEVDETGDQVDVEVDEMGEHFEVVEEEEVEEEEEPEDGTECTIPPNYGSFEAPDFTGDMLQGFNNANMPLNLQGQQLQGNSSMELFASNADTHLIMGGPSMFGNGHKRVIDYEQDASQLHDNKRIRTDIGWDNKTSDFGFCMDQIEQLMERAKTIHEEKEQDLQNVNMNHQYLYRELQQRENMIETLQRNKNEELQKKDREIFRLERELCLLGELVNGYREALKENKRQFSEYRQRCQLPEEPIYKDAGPGGLVLSVTELEKLREKQEREDSLNRTMIEQKCDEALEGYTVQFKELLAKVEKINIDRLTPIENEVKQLKDSFAAKRKTSQKASCETSE